MTTSSTKKQIRVVAAVIQQEGRYLITQRRAQGSFPNMWEFPGGKVEASESEQQALQRELQERLAARVIVGDKLGEKEHHYPQHHVVLSLYAVQLPAGQTLQHLRVQNVAWVQPQELGLYEFPDVDQQALALLGTDLP